jgi:hypothetical protein
MRILDIDMDFFLDNIANFRNFDGERLSDLDYKPWNVEAVINYLENNCGLNKSNKVQGAIFAEHVGVFHVLRKLIDKKLVHIPFEIVHIDAHADLGLGDSAWHYIYSTLLSFKKEERLKAIIDNLKRNESGKVSSGNYLLYMIALEWISNLTYIPHYSEPGDDYPQLIMKEFDDNSSIIQLKNYKYNISFDELKRKEFEPQYEVPFQIVREHMELKNNNPFNYVFFSQSISYTPAGADILLNVFKEYIDFENFRDSLA